MSNHLALATVTATLCHILQQGLTRDKLPGTVATGRPDTLADQQSPRTNVYLYQITPNAAWRNVDLGWRDSDGTVVQTPRTALDLHYLLSFTGDETTLVPQRLLGSAVRSLLSPAALGKKIIAKAISDPLFSQVLLDSDLQDQPEAVRFSPQPLSVDEMSKLWAVFPQTAYALSVGYQATVVLIDAADAPRPVQTVRQRVIGVHPIRYPSIDSVSTLDGRDPIADINSTLVLAGNNLSADAASLFFQRAQASNDAPIALTANQMISDRRLEIKLADIAARVKLRAGPQMVQVIHLISPSDAASHPHVAFESNVQTFVLRPRFAAAPVVQPAGGTTPATLKASVQPLIGINQRVIFLLTPVTGAVNPPAYTINADPGRADDVNLVTAALTGVNPGSYNVRVQIDGAQTIYETDQTGAITGPMITIP